MGLLSHNLPIRYHRIAEKVYQRQFELDERLEEEYDEERRQRMFEDILHNLSFLETAIRLEDQKIFDEYAVWLFKLMVYLMPDLGEERVRQQMIMHYELLEEVLEQELSPKKYKTFQAYLLTAIRLTKTTSVASEDKQSFLAEGQYGHVKETYLRYLMENDSENALAFLKSVAEDDVPLIDLYDEILYDVMVEIGELWHRRIIDVDQEHYMTSFTQKVMAQFYDRIFSSDKHEHTAIVASVGGELHEMGPRMISDLLEEAGWDSLYLGAGVPKKSLLRRVKLADVALVVLSVTMPQHLYECKKIVEAIKEQFPSTHVAVGGRAFRMTSELWKKWPVDFYSDKAREFLEWTKKTFRDAHV